MQEIVIAAAQLISIRGEVEGNIEKHLSLIELAADNKVQIIVFPELSLTGYEPDLAKELAFSFNDERLIPLREIASKRNIIIIAGAPVLLGTGLHISSFFVFPDSVKMIYTKRYLHPGEEKYFSPGYLNPVFNFNSEVISTAICADISNPQHPVDASKAGSTIYLASVLITLKGYNADSALLKEYAKKYNMTVLMANHGGDSGGYNSAGRSAIWSDTGDLISEFAGPGEGLVAASKENGCWSGRVIK